MLFSQQIMARINHCYYYISLCLTAFPTYPHVQLMVQVLVNLLVVTVLLEQTAQHTGAADPQNLGGQTSLSGTVALTCSILPEECVCSLVSASSVQQVVRECFG